MLKAHHFLSRNARKEMHGVYAFDFRTLTQRNPRAKDCKYLRVKKYNGCSLSPKTVTLMRSIGRHHFS